MITWDQLISCVSIDAIVVHPIRAANDGRELWLNAPSERVLRGQVKCSSCESGNKLLQVFPVQADLSDATPLDQALILDGKLTVILPAGRYTVRVWDGSRVVFTGQTFLDNNFSLSF